MFALIWIVVWALVFDIFNDPTGWQIAGFVFIGLGGPLGKYLLRKD